MPRLQWQARKESLGCRGKVAYPLVHLLAADVMQAAVQVLHALYNVLDLVLILGLNLACFANSHVQAHSNGTLAVGQPSRCRDIGVSHETNAVLAGVGGRESETTGVVLALVHNTVIIVECLLNGDLDLQVVVDGVDTSIGVDDLSVELACLSKEREY